MEKKLACSVFFGMWLAAGGGYAQKIPAISGRIIPADGGERLPEAMTLYLRSLRGVIVDMRAVHSSGRFDFYSLPPGNYILSLEVPGRVTTSAPAQVLDPGDTNPTYFVTLRVGPVLAETDELPDKEEQVTSARYLSLSDSVKSELELAERATEEGNHRAAIEHLTRALEEMPDLYHAYNNLAVEYLALEEVSKAVQALETSIEINPKVASTHRNLGAIYLDYGRPEEALGHFKTALELEAEDLLCILYSGEANYQLRRFKEATLFFERVIEAESTNLDARLYLGNCYLNTGKNEQALAAFEWFLKHAEDDPRTAEVRAVIERLKNQ